jgi:hypothetical protein
VNKTLTGYLYLSGGTDDHARQLSIESAGRTLVVSSGVPGDEMFEETSVLTGADADLFRSLLSRHLFLERDHLIEDATDEG